MSGPARAFRILRRTFMAVTLAGVAAAPLDLAHAQYPERQITLIVCFPPGGGTDIARGGAFSCVMYFSPSLAHKTI